MPTTSRYIYYAVYVPRSHRYAHTIRTLLLTCEVQHTINMPPFARHKHGMFVTGHAPQYPSLTPGRDSGPRFHFSLLVYFIFISSDASTFAFRVSFVSRINF